MNSAVIHHPESTINAATAARLRAKYESRNPLQRWLLGRFLRRVRAWIDALHPKRILDFGCGEGYFWNALAERGPLPEVVGIDVRREAIEQARVRAPVLTVYSVDLFEFDPKGLRFDLVIASQVLEHLYEPERSLKRLCELSSGWLLLTVPHEPFFQLCNLARGRDFFRLGNHPEHVQHWSKTGFTRFARRLLDVVQVETVFPFILLLGRVRANAPCEFARTPGGPRPPPIACETAG